MSDDDQDTDVESDATTNESELSVHFKRDSNNENLFREQLAVDFNSEAEEKDENEKELKYDSELANSEAVSSFSFLSRTFLFFFKNF